MSDLRELYQQLILDHGRNPRCFGDMESATCQHCGHNPLCGDQLTVYVKHDGATVRQVQFTGSGCAISMASASLMAEALQGVTLIKAHDLFGAMHQLLTEGQLADSHQLGKLQALAGVADYPMRVKCATLAWHTFIAALQQQATITSTE